jgi:hypothetical protein
MGIFWVDSQGAIQKDIGLEQRRISGVNHFGFGRTVPVGFI